MSPPALLPSGDRLRGYAYRASGPVQLHLGDARDALTAMPDTSVDCIMTSPPYWSLLH
ncbi:hypothetical protein ACFPIJ_47190 [Dactylosporangium cerinum]|uniref:site-specific DNA-methyltransferase (cytosine-N(4)-specific) n=1 Tax=Dactylosporangium cerinum TaxID=1434730 RepID=A0ABV9WCA3_9ACTN